MAGSACDSADVIGAAADGSQMHVENVQKHLSCTKHLGAELDTEYICVEAKPFHLLNNPINHGIGTVERRDPQNMSKPLL